MKIIFLYTYTAVFNYLNNKVDHPSIQQLLLLEYFHLTISG